MPTKLTLALQTSSTATIELTNDDICIDELQRIIELYSMIRSRDMRVYVEGFISGAALSCDKNNMERIAKLTIDSYRGKEYTP